MTAIIERAYDTMAEWKATAPPSDANIPETFDTYRSWIDVLGAQIDILHESGLDSDIPGIEDEVTYLLGLMGALLFPAPAPTATEPTSEEPQVYADDMFVFDTGNVDLGERMAHISSVEIEPVGVIGDYSA